MRKYSLPIVIAALALPIASGFAPNAANANPITVYSGTSPTSLVAINTTNSGILTGTATGTDISIGYSASGSPVLAQPSLDTTAIEVNTSGNATSPYYLAFAETGLTTPLGVNKFLSSFSNTSFSGAISAITLTTEISTSNAAYGGTVLATTTYTASNASVNDTDATPFLSNPYSETALYEITWSGIGDSDSGVSLAVDPPVPEPSSLALLGPALLGLGVLVRRRRVASEAFLPAAR